MPMGQVGMGQQRLGFGQPWLQQQMRGQLGQVPQRQGMSGNQIAGMSGQLISQFLPFPFNIIGQIGSSFLGGK